jgi:hypothetical protein
MYGTLTTTVNNAFMTSAARNAPGATQSQLGGAVSEFALNALVPGLGSVLGFASSLFDFGASQQQADQMRESADRQYALALSDIKQAKLEMASQRTANFRAMQANVGKNQVNYGYGMAGSKSAARIVAMTSAARDIRDYQGRASDSAAIARARNNAAMAKYNAYAEAASVEASGTGSLIGGIAGLFA